MIAFDRFGFSIEGSGFRVQNLGLGFYVLGAGSSMYGSGFWVREPFCSLLLLLLTTLRFTDARYARLRFCVHPNIYSTYMHYTYIPAPVLYCDFQYHSMCVYL